jgi:Rieske Fe-S protein
VRLRLVAVLVVATALVLGAASVITVAVWRRGSSESGVVNVDLAHLRRGSVLTSAATVKAANLQRAAIYVARESDGAVLAFLGRSTHLGCRVLLTSDRQVRRMQHASNTVFEDPCGGSQWALTGVCISGPCPRDLDRFPITVTDDRATIDISTIVVGSTRHVMT